MMFCQRCNTQVVELQWQAYNGYCASCDHIYRKPKEPRRLVKEFSPELVAVWEWVDEKSMPKCQLYMYDILVSNLYMNPDFTTLYDIENVLNYSDVQLRISDYHTRADLFRKQ